MTNKDESHIGQLLKADDFMACDDLGNPVFLEEKFKSACDNYMKQTDKPALVALLDLVEAAQKDLNGAIDAWSVNLKKYTQK